MNFPEIKVSVKRKGERNSSEFFIMDPEDAAKAFWYIFDSDTIDWREEAILLLLDRKNEVIGYHKVAAGGTTGATVDPKVVFTTALKGAAQNVIIAHNHPSGKLEPSKADMALTRQLKEAGELLQIELLDHLILTRERFYSFKDEGKL